MDIFLFMKAGDGCSPSKCAKLCLFCSPASGEHFDDVCCWLCYIWSANNWNGLKPWARRCHRRAGCGLPGNGSEDGCRIGHKFASTEYKCFSFSPEDGIKHIIELIKNVWWARYFMLQNFYKQSVIMDGDQMALHRNESSCQKTLTFKDADRMSS